MIRELYPYQRRWLNDDAKFKAGMFSRQSGKTMTTCLELVKSIITAELHGAREDWLILSSGDRQAKEAMETHIKPNLRAFEKLYSASEPAPDARIDDFGTIRYNAYEVVLPGGSRITAVPANPDTARGYSRHLVLDEFAFHRDSNKIWQAVFPIVSRPELKLRVISTPNGKGNKFHEIMTGADTSWSRHIVDIHTAIAQGLPREATALRDAIGDEATWQQEYELRWLDGNRAWISFEMIQACEYEQGAQAELVKGAYPPVVGVDIARRRDLFVIVVLQQRDDVLYTLEIIARQNIPFQEQMALLAHVTATYQPSRIAIDQTGMGEMFAETAVAELGAAVHVEGVLLTANRRLAIATAMRRVFEDRRIRIPADRALRNDLHSMRAEQGASGTTRLVHDRQVSHHHADRFWAMALAVASADLLQDATGVMDALDLADDTSDPEGGFDGDDDNDDWQNFRTMKGIM